MRSLWERVRRHRGVITPADDTLRTTWLPLSAIRNPRRRSPRWAPISAGLQPDIISYYRRKGLADNGTGRRVFVEVDLERCGIPAAMSICSFTTLGTTLAATRSTEPAARRQPAGREGRDPTEVVGSQLRGRSLLSAGRSSRRLQRSSAQGGPHLFVSSPARSERIMSHDSWRFRSNRKVAWSNLPTITSRSC